MKIIEFILPLAFVAILPLCPSPIKAQTIMENLLEPLIEQEKLPGFLSIVATKDEILEVDAIGYANKEQKTPINPDHLFWIASTTKFMTATAIMMLVDEGKIKLDDPIDIYIPEMKLNLRVAEKHNEGTLLRAPKSMPTIRQCLNHTTGFPFASEFMKRFGVDSLPLQYQTFAVSLTPLLADPGEISFTSELGFDIVGEIIEVVSGIPYERFMQERIFDPLEMKDTTFWPTSEQQSRLVRCYTEINGKLVPTELPALTSPYENKSIRFPDPGCGLFSTGNDLLKFFQMYASLGTYKGKRYLSEKSIHEMIIPNPKQKKEKYGLGTAREGTWFGHEGMCGTLCHASIDGLVRIYLSQVHQVPAHEEGIRLWSEGVVQILRTHKLIK